MKWEGRGSYTVEGTLIISFICLITGLVKRYTDQGGKNLRKKANA